MSDRQFIPLDIAVLTVSDSRNEETDKSGKLLVDRLTGAGHRCAAKLIVPDDVYRIRAVVSGWIADEGVQVVITTGAKIVYWMGSDLDAVKRVLDVVEVFHRVHQEIPAHLLLVGDGPERHRVEQQRQRGTDRGRERERRRRKLRSGR